jgi:hypothetical protein
MVRATLGVFLLGSNTHSAMLGTFKESREEGGDAGAKEGRCGDGKGR